nr:MAG: ORF1 [Torque teno midi virus]
MPFWWRRRNKRWWGRRFRYRRYNKYKTRRRRRLPRRRNRRFTKTRRRRKRKKVRRKLKKITIKQWQPDSVKKCKIKGYSTLVMGAQGKQYNCYTNQASDYVQPKAPQGGGFGCEVFNLKWLYQEYTAHRNIWTKSNEYTDLCRFTGAQIILYRHPDVDFIVAYDNQPPFLLNKYTYPELQPQNLLLARRKRIILSQKSNPKGKLRIKLKIPPPKQMLTKWFFQRDFAEVNLFKLCASAASFRYPGISHGAQSTIFSAYALNTDFYQCSDWCQTNTTTGYLNIKTQKMPLWFHYREAGKEKWYKYTNTEHKDYQNIYLKSISYSDGLFSPKAMFAFEVKAGGTGETQPSSEATLIANLPLIPLRYNPHEDTGHGNEIYLTSTFKGTYDKPKVTDALYFNNVPLWMGFYGYWDFILQETKNKGVFDQHMFVVKCPALRPISQATKQVYYPLVDMDFCSGRLPFDEYLSKDIKSHWYPTAERQTVTINNFVTAGPYMPKFEPTDKDSTWQLNYHYKFFFKWGGPQVTDPTVEDPSSRNKYPVPDTVQQTIQIKNPEKLHPATIFHDWDLRRGFITQAAIKRMSENLQIDSSFESDGTESPKKKKRCTKEIPTQNQKQEEIQECLLSLCEEPTCQEETEDIQLFIQQQQQQQYKLRKNLFKLLTHLKKGQRISQLQTGLLE